ncbi:MAG TPA: TadG family pilus assembly protein [Gemmatimonadaceae bacterium]|nr:TadG family pilus assembly protein [Gemmatimonadaceae bacterium]
MRNRRGAIVVMTGIFIVAIMVIAAISVDASRIFAAKNELQTASDAAALAGALQLLEGVETFEDTARVYAQRNRVEQNGIDSVEVEYGVWLPTDRSFVAGGEPKDAVRVTTRHPLPLSLARVFGDSTVMVSASAIAWSAGPVMEPQCIKPLAVPYSRLLQILGHPAWSDIALTDDDIRQLREMPVSARKWHFHLGDMQTEHSQAGGTQFGENHLKWDQYFPIDIDSTYDRADPGMFSRPSLDTATYRSYLAGPPDGRCSARVRPGDQVRSEPEPKVRAVRDGLGEICRSLGGDLVGTNVLTCRANGARIELPLRVVYWSGFLPDPDAVPWYDDGARSRLITRTTGSFVVDSLDWNQGNEVLHARMHGYFDVQPAFGVVDETAASTLLRPVLVR